MKLLSHEALTRLGGAVLALLAGCSPVEFDPSLEPTTGNGEPSTIESLLTTAQKRSRCDIVKAQAAPRGITNPVVFAGVANHETGMAQCWSEATWACQGPSSSDCGGGPVIAGSGDGPCSYQQGGLGMYQFDSGTYSQTLSSYGSGILSISGNVSKGIDTILYKMQVCPNTRDFITSDAQAIAYLNRAKPGTTEFETFLTTMAWCYNGCTPTGCSAHNERREDYRRGVTELLNLFGESYWHASSKVGPAVFYDQQDGTGRIYRWTSNGSTFGNTATYDSGNYSLANVGDRFVSGDFSGDGKDDIATAYQNADGTFSFYVWKNGLSSTGVWYTSGPFDLSRVAGRMVAGDFNNDGKDDLALVYDVGDGTLRIYRWLSSGTAFGSVSTYQSGTFPVSSVGERVAAADFNGDGADDIVMAYQNPDGTFGFHVWKNGLTHAGIWFTSGPFNLDSVAGRIVAGRFTSDAKADVALVYDVGDGTMRIYRWVSSGTAFSSYNTYQGTGIFRLSNVGDRVAAGDVDGDGDDDIVMAYQLADGTFSTYVWEDLVYSGQWYTSGPFSLSQVGGRFVLGAW